MFQKFNGSPSKQELKEYGKGMASLSLLLIPIECYFDNSLNLTHFFQYTLHGLALSGFFFILKSFAPIALKPLYLLWMSISMAIGLITGPIILFCVYYGVITPVGLLSRLTGKKWLNTDKNKQTYWQTLEAHNPEHFERQF